MTPEELDEARAEEAVRRFGEPDDKYELAYERELAAIAARLAREGWTPPKPVVDPDVLAFREWLMEREPDTRGPSYEYDADFWDNSMSAQAYLAGARMAREQERERAKVLMECVERYAGPHAAMAIAKYQGET